MAVKTLKESAGERERKDLVQELKVLKSLGQHPNVLSLLACCTEKGKAWRKLNSFGKLCYIYMVDAFNF